MSTRFVTLVRHAKSSWRFDDLDDLSRPLSARGLRDCRRVPKRLAERVPAPERVVCSHAARALQTCEAVAQAYGLQSDAVVVEPDLYLAPAAEILRIAARHGGKSVHLMLVGHNPGLTDAYNALSPKPIENLPTFGVAHLQVEADGWRQLRGAQARVLELIFPKLL